MSGGKNISKKQITLETCDCKLKVLCSGLANAAQANGMKFRNCPVAGGG